LSLGRRGRCVRLRVRTVARSLPREGSRFVRRHGTADRFHVHTAPRGPKSLQSRSKLRIAQRCRTVVAASSGSSLRTLSGAPRHRRPLLAAHARTHSAPPIGRAFCTLLHKCPSVARARRYRGGANASRSACPRPWAKRSAKTRRRSDAWGRRAAPGEDEGAAFGHWGQSWKRPRGGASPISCKPAEVIRTGGGRAQRARRIG